MTDDAARRRYSVERTKGTQLTMISFRAQQERKDNIEGLAASQGIPAAAVIHRALDEYKPLRAYENKQRKENMENDHGRSTDKPQ